MTEAAQPSLDGSPLPALGEVLDFLRLIWAVDQALQRLSSRMETTMGVTGPQRLVIRIVGKFPGFPAGHLARLLHVHPGTVSGIVKRLERQGMIRRRPDPRDGRRTLLGLTDKGRSFDIEASGTIEAAIQKTLDSVAAEKLHATREVLAALTAFLSAASTESATEPVARRGDE